MKRPTKYMRSRMLLKNKPRKILNLEERVQAIFLYEREPVYQRVATTLQCSWEQIKNVIANRRSILKYYVDCQSIKTDDDERLVRRKKINFLGNLMFEYIKRVHYHWHMLLDDDVVRERALQFRDIIEIENFYPNRAWVGDFKKTYNIDFNCLANIIIIQPPENSLESKDIVDYCMKELDRALAISVGTNSESSEEESMNFPTSTTIQKNELSHHNDDVDIEDNDIDMGTMENYDGNGDGEDDVDIQFLDDEDGLTIDFGQYEVQSPTVQQRSATSTATVEAKTSREGCVNVKPKPTQGSNISKPAIKGHATNVRNQVKATSTNEANVDRKFVYNFTEALTWLRPLELFAVNEEDFHAMNLLSQLAQHYETRSEN